MNKVVLITGASRGIGRSCAGCFAKGGYNVVINYLNSDEEALNLKEELEKKYNIECLLVKADVSLEDDVKNMVDTAIDKFGKIDCLVNNASIAIDSVFEDKTKESFQRMLDINLIGTFLVSKYVAKYMKVNRDGCIINISSTNGIDTNYPFSMEYDASKAGVISLTKNLAVELAPYIRVNSVAPGWVNTDMNRELSYEFKKSETDKILLGRFAFDYEIAKVVYFLASSDASYINGSVIKVDGGSR